LKEKGELQTAKMQQTLKMLALCVKDSLKNWFGSFIQKKTATPWGVTEYLFL